MAFVKASSGIAGSRTVGFTVVDDGGAASTTANETVSVAAAGAGGAPDQPTAPAQTLSQQQSYATQGNNLLRAGPNDGADPTSPLYSSVQQVKAIAPQLDAGRLSSPDAQSALRHLVDGTTSVAEISYAFFTGRTPSQAGLNYLVHSTANPTDLNDAYYAGFGTENRYINFAAILATGPRGRGVVPGELRVAVARRRHRQGVPGRVRLRGRRRQGLRHPRRARLRRPGRDGDAGAVLRRHHRRLGRGAEGGRDRLPPADSVKEAFGAYQQADLHFLADLAHGAATFNVDLLAAYGTAPTLVGQPTPDQTLTGG